MTGRGGHDGRDVGFVVALAAALTAGFLLLGFNIFLVPRYAEGFAELGVVLPRAAQFSIDFADIMVGRFGFT